MPANTAPIFTLTPNYQGTPVGGAANTKSDGQGTIATDIFKCFTAGANGSWARSIRFHLYGTTAATNSTATVHRIYISNKTSGSTTSADTWLYYEINAIQQSADSSTTPTFAYEIPLNIFLPAGYTILVSSHAANAANTGWMASVQGGDY